jgi:hypothetical protein
MEWIRGLFVSLFEGKMLAEAQRLAFYLTAHFSEDDYPYDWQVHFITSLSAYSRPCLYRLMYWLSKVRFTRKQKLTR